MKNLNRLLSGVTALLAFVAVARGQSLSDVPSALLHVTTNDFQRGVNLQSQRGAALSSTVGTPIGSDGRIPLGQLTPTPGQFQGVVSYGAVTVAASPASLGAGSFAANADAIDFPRAKDGATVNLILRAQAGAYWISQESSLLFGAVIPPPDTDINGNTLTGAALTNYWAAEPFSTNNHAGAAYYYSPHAGKVFAIQAGDVRITWRRSAALVGEPADYVGNENVKYAFVGGSYYELQPASMVVAEGAFKLTRKMYWTEGIFAATGKKVAVPAETVKDIQFGYNSVFPQHVPTNEVFGAAGASSPFGAGASLVDTRTLWSEYGFISANNKEGRVFVELLGNVVAGSTRQHLGYEIVDVTREALPEDVTVELGERLTAFPNNSPSDAGLRPSAFLNAIGVKYVYEHFSGTGGAVTADAPREYFATRVTPELNSSQLLWLEQGIGGLSWPSRLVRYQQVWPTDVAKYSHYIRPLVATATAAAQTAVQLSAENAPVIESDDVPDQTRSILQPDSKFYTFLDAGVPALRTLLRFNAGGKIRFERVFSWLDANLRTTNFAGSVVTELSAWNSADSTLNFGGAVQIPRVVNQNVWVGQRLTAPVGESNSVSGISYPGLGAASTGFSYLAGHIRQSEGTGYSVTAYRDPFVVGFDEAVASSIIPVNAGNNDARLEVWWFRPNAVNTAVGFKNVFWPSAIGRYTVAWPTNFPQAREIILASNAGSGGLGSLEAKGGLYFQNDPSLPGYNPNEEHALMQGGQVWALRDDLNITGGTNRSSHAYVLLQYTAADGRPSMTAFQVLREKANVKFDYTLAAGTILQAPMPLPLLDRPLGTREVGEPARSLNIEVRARTVGSATVTEAGGFSQVTLATGERLFFQPYESLALQNVPATGPVTSRWFYSTNSDPMNNQLAGVVTTLAPLTLGVWTASAQPADTTKYRFKVASLAGLQPGRAVVVGRAALQTNWVASIADTNIVSGQAFVELQFTGAAPLAAQTDSVLAVPNSGLLATAFNGWRLGYESLPESISDPVIRERFAGFTFQDRKGDTWIYRGPHQVGGSAKMVMQFYYKTLAGFYFPSLAPNAQPRLGTLTPYLRPLNPDGSYAGDPVLGDADTDNVGDGNPLGVVYRSVWSESAPVMMMAETLATPKRGLPAMRGQSSLQVLYQQSQFAGGLAARAAVLHDPTRQKQFLLGPVDGSAILGKIPDSVRTSVYRGKTYFPNLPPHLVERFYFDPTRGANGGLVLVGEFKQEIVGDSFFLLNVLGPQDATALRALCIADDPNKARWDAVINSGLQTTMEQFVEDAGRPGTFVPGPTVAIGPADLAEVTDQDVAVDSYALTASGPGSGYVSLIAANGRAFTPVGDPVSVQIVKVVDTLYRGELKIVKPSNPLSEMLTLQQVVDLAGKVDDYQFEWLISAPVDGAPPALYQNTRQLLMGNGTWNHVRFPLATDQPATVHHASADRVIPEITTTVAPASLISFASVADVDGDLSFVLTPGQPHPLAVGNQLVVRTDTGAEAFGTVKSVAATTHLSQPATNLVVAIDAGQAILPTSPSVIQLYERAVVGQPASVAFRQFSLSEGSLYSQFYLSLDLASSLSAKVYLDGQLVAVVGFGSADTATVSAPGGFSPLSRVYRLGPDQFGGGQRSGGVATHALAVEFYSAAQPGAQLAFNARLEAYESVDQTSLPGSPWLALDSAKFQDKVRAILGGSADVRSLTDNYLVARYRATNETHASFSRGWSQWTEPQLAEGWIKRVLAGINPFNQRVTDLFNNQVNTDASILTQAGKRWEGDVALNLENINNAGLIEIYETVLRRGKMLSLEAGINYGPANDALLLAAGYLNDLYMMLGNEAYADASNPTIGIGSKDRDYGDIATALFAFKGQAASLLEEELALLRGRDDFIQPGVEAQPVYNRMFWNYTRGIDAGEVIYALNYNIQPNGGTNASIGAADAAHMFPQGHGDGYGHYLTTVKNYYSLLLDPSFDWVPKSEAVTVLGRAVQVNYQNERKFAAAAAAVARTGSQVLDLTWRRDYVSGDDIGWESLSQSRTNLSRTVPTTRYWGVDHWASRTAQGAYLNWAMGNAILPATDPDPSHEGIQKVDRTTVPELAELPATAIQVQLSLDNAEGHFTPLGMPGSSLAFDINPNQITGTNPKPHFEQVYERAKATLNNAITAFDDAKDVTRLMRSDTDSLTDFQATVAKQELAYTHSLIELYGTAYSDDIGPGKTWRQGYAGPDLIHYSYVDMPELAIPAPWDYASPTAENTEFRIDVQDFPADWLSNLGLTDLNLVPSDANGYTPDVHYISFNLGAHGFGGKPAAWTGTRAMPGKIQQAASKVIMAHARLRQAAADQAGGKEDLDRVIALFRAHINTHDQLRKLEKDLLIAEQTLEASEFALDIYSSLLEYNGNTLKDTAEAMSKAFPRFFVAGLANGVDVGSVPASATDLAGVGAKSGWDLAEIIASTVVKALGLSTSVAQRWTEFNKMAPLEWDDELRSSMAEVGGQLGELQDGLAGINTRVRELDDARRDYRALVAQGERIQEERLVFRQRAAAITQGYRTRDAAFRIFRNEKLERYKTLFDLSARYTFMAANAYDYETGLLNTTKGKQFISRIVNSRALGVVKSGEPQYAGSNTGDPGLSSVLAEMKADWDVLKGRLGFNNPTAYGTTVSLRTENHRIVNGTEGDTTWKDVLNQARRSNLLEDEDVRRHCMQIAPANSLTVPGLVIEFSTTIADGRNFFGRELAGGDHYFDPSYFATKIFSVGVAFDGYKGMDNPTANSGVVGSTGSTSPTDPTASFLDPQALAATPGIYLIPVGVDSMRSPPLGDSSAVRSWAVNDVTIPLPFNIGASDFSTKLLYQSSDSLTEPLFNLRKHPAFRPVSTTAAFTSSIYGGGGQLQQSQFTNTRLVGRSVWNSKWKLVIPGHKLLSDPNDGLDRFINTVKDVKLHLVTYSYAGN
ncbi:MAG: hypothetical protein B9S33_09375 [Pedosphaera sp. Tous-C6FEB]|nr:MAG: hypothetical protein B9S33_09375 [Pedosphaera sp. Tous-C6FEB]